MVLMVFVFLIMAIPPLLVMVGVARVSRRLVAPARTSLLVVASTLLLAPLPGPATIMVVPAPAAYLLVPAILSGSWADLSGWLAEYPRWSLVAFAGTAAVAYAVIRAMRPNNSSKPTPLRGAA